MTEKVGIVGIEHTKLGKRTDATPRELAHEAVTQALEDAGACIKPI
ncbi:MAG: hypothetical protein ACETVP_02165 [Candidatus Bathyarchaeia archaeon]